MTDNHFIDTNVLVYCFDLSEKEKYKRANRLIKDLKETSNLFISSQVLNEFINIVTRKIENPISFENLKSILSILTEIFFISPLTSDNSLSAIDIKTKHQFSYWDSLIIASALENGCNHLYTEDLQDGQIIEKKLEIINPFKL
ncbi:MAG: PIN domain-containing protein [Candidatus Aminicenantes bacterium]|jgi:predicted nucleic acid-binding protein